MKKILLLLTSFFLFSCYNQERNCKAFKTGKFTSETTVEGKKYTTTFERNDSMQIENFNNKIDTFSIRWINDCEYILENIKPKNREEKKAVHVKILNTKDLTYNFEYSFVGETKKQKGSVTKM
ncbi:DNA topoisomerase IV [Flavobacterium sp.]|uniref:DNA topoisomerase IV n=1 Tax=Flavobacterium sp. TaxID=239 RepID=UPI0035B0D61E